MNKCEEHNWLYEEFDEPCPLCEVAQTTTDNILRLLNNYYVLTQNTRNYAFEVLPKIMEDIKNGQLD
jgi:hypothetical protein